MRFSGRAMPPLMPNRFLTCHKSHGPSIPTKPLFMRSFGPRCGTVWGAVTPPLYPALFSTPRFTPIGRETLSNCRVSSLGHKAPAGRCRGRAGQGTVPARPRHTGWHRRRRRGICLLQLERRSVLPVFVPFSWPFHLAAQSSTRCRRGRFPVLPGRGRPSQFRFQIVGSSVMITSFL